MLKTSPMYAYIPASDLARAKRFYEQKLGLVPKEEKAGGFLYEFAGGTACFMYSTPNAGSSRANQAYWQVDDIAREVAELRRRGVEFEEYDVPGMKSENGIVTANGARVAWFRDSEGNILALVQLI
jgi:predicted enzyme related to lactoylglutathione lyase